MKTKTTFFLAALLVVLFAGCAQRGDDDPDSDGGNGMAIDPPSNSGSWACRSGVDSDGRIYIEFNPAYLNGGTVQTAYIVGEAQDEAIYGWFHGAYRQEAKHPVSGRYRLILSGAVGSTGVLTYASKVDTVGNDSSAWAQYGGSLTAEAAGPFRWNSSGTNYACRYKIENLDRPAVPYSN